MVDSRVEEFAVSTPPSAGVAGPAVMLLAAVKGVIRQLRDHLTHPDRDPLLGHRPSQGLAWGGSVAGAAGLGRRRPGPPGALAAIAAAPGADVTFVAHTGLEHVITLGDVWRALPMERVLKARWWRAEAETWISCLR